VVLVSLPEKAAAGAHEAGLRAVVDSWPKRRVAAYDDPHLRPPAGGHAAAAGRVVSERTLPGWT
jgi:hypothetical protein